MTARSGELASLRELDWLMVAAVTLACLGLVMAVTISGPRLDSSPLDALRGHGAKLTVGLVVFLVAATVRLSWLERLAVPVFAGGVVLCLAALLFPNANGASRWIRFGTASFQPVEFARFGLILFAAAWIGRAGEELRSFRTGFVPLMGAAGVLASVLLMQPDVGNAVFALTLVAAMALVGGVRVLHFGLAGLPIVACMLLFVSQLGYVRDRFAGFLEVQPGSQVWQSLVAISSGGLSGTGLGEGWMKMGFVPEAYNDFVFAIIGEEMGFLGGLLVIGLYTVIGGVGLRLVLTMQDPFRRMLVFGFTFAVCMQAAINLLVVTGMAPAKGIDLPLLSSGGTNLMFTLGAIGMIGNAARTDRACR